MRTVAGRSPTKSRAFVADPVRACPDSVDVYFDPVHWSVVDVPITYLVNEHDRPTPPELQREMADRLPGAPSVHGLDSGHIPAVTAPDLLAESIVRATHS